MKFRSNIYELLEFSWLTKNIDAVVSYFIDWSIAYNTDVCQIYRFLIHAVSPYLISRKYLPTILSLRLLYANIWVFGNFASHSIRKYIIICYLYHVHYLLLFSFVYHSL